MRSPDPLRGLRLSDQQAIEKRDGNREYNVWLGLDG